MKNKEIMFWGGTMSRKHKEGYGHSLLLVWVCSLEVSASFSPSFESHDLSLKKMWIRLILFYNLKAKDEIQTIETMFVV